MASARFSLHPTPIGDALIVVTDAGLVSLDVRDPVPWRSGSHVKYVVRLSGAVRESRLAARSHHVPRLVIDPGKGLT